MLHAASGSFLLFNSTNAHFDSISLHFSARLTHPCFAMRASMISWISPFMILICAKIEDKVKTMLQKTYLPCRKTHMHMLQLIIRKEMTKDVSV